MLERAPPQFRELQEITMQTDTRDILAHATRQSESYEDYFLVDIDAHVTETSFWPEILALIDNDVIRQMGQANAARPGNASYSLLNSQPGMLHQHLYGRIPHQQALLEPVEKKGAHHFTELARRAMRRLPPGEAEELQQAWRRYCEVIAELDQATAAIALLRTCAS